MIQRVVNGGRREGDRVVEFVEWQEGPVFTFYRGVCHRPFRLGDRDCDLSRDFDHRRLAHAASRRGRDDRGNQIRVRASPSRCCALLGGERKSFVHSMTSVLKTPRHPSRNFDPPLRDPRMALPNRKALGHCLRDTFLLMYDRCACNQSMRDHLFHRVVCRRDQTCCHNLLHSFWVFSARRCLPLETLIGVGLLFRCLRIGRRYALPTGAGRLRPTGRVSRGT